MHDDAGRLGDEVDSCRGRSASSSRLVAAGFASSHIPYGWLPPSLGTEDGSVPSLEAEVTWLHASDPWRASLGSAEGAAGGRA